MPKEEQMSPCGAVCCECEYFPNACKGCGQIQGKVFWLEYTGGKICGVYDCCINKKRYANCGQCSSLPCSRYEKDPTKTDEENERGFKRQLERLRRQ